MKKSLLIFAWEYDGYHSERGAALSRRITQVAESFNDNNWDVIVIHKDNRNECKDVSFIISIEKNGIKRISVKLDRDIEDFNKVVFIRKFETLYYITFFGDRSYFWADEVINNFDKFGIDKKPDYILSFYTPRVTLFLGKHFSEKLNIPWIADIQDPIYQGISKMAIFFCKIWIKNVLKTAKSIVHVSPEWAEEDGNAIGRKIKTLRHAVPEDHPRIVSDFDFEFRNRYGDSFNIFYGGSLSPDIQSLSKLKQVIEYAISVNIKIKLLVAGNNITYDLFHEAFGDQLAIQLGWLTPVQMNQYIYNCNCTLVIPWSKEKIGIPSKFFELCSFKKPIWIIGDDIGGFKSLLSEWEHPLLPLGDFEYQKKALMSAIKNDDFSLMFNVENCKGHIIKASEIFSQYLALL